MPDETSLIEPHTPAASLLLYSTNTWLAYKVSKEYYGDLHYVWCSPHFSSQSVPSYDYANPPSSSPSEIYQSLLAEVTRDDLHSVKIEANRVGIMNGANIKEASKTITNRQKREIHSIVKQAERSYFRPLLYIIPFSLVCDRVREVPVKLRAHPFSREFVIEDLPRTCFDIIEYGYHRG